MPFGHPQNGTKVTLPYYLFYYGKLYKIEVG